METEVRVLIYCERACEIQHLFSYLLDYFRKAFPNDTIATFDRRKIYMSPYTVEFCFAEELAVKTQGAHWDHTVPAKAVDIWLTRQRRERNTDES